MLIWLINFVVRNLERLRSSIKFIKTSFTLILRSPCTLLRLKKRRWNILDPPSELTVIQVTCEASINSEMIDINLLRLLSI